MSLQYVVLTLDLYDGQGNAVITGTAALVPSAQLKDTTDHMIITAAPVPAVFHAAGFPQVTLLATDNGNLSPSWTWGISFTGVPGNPAGFSFSLPHSGGASQYLSSLAP
jgi:hypothetical protein